MPRRVHTPAASAGAEAGRFGADTLETSQLLLELIHVAYATRGADSTLALDATGPVPAEPPSTHVIRAAIHVYQHGERTIGELATGLGISYGWASRVVSSLEDQGMVVRRADPNDRRVVRVSLTSRAIEMVEGAYRWRGDAVERALASLDEDGRQAVMTFLRRVTHELAAAAQERRKAS